MMPERTELSAPSIDVFSGTQMTVQCKRFVIVESCNLPIPGSTVGNVHYPYRVLPLVRILGETIYWCTDRLYVALFFLTMRPVKSIPTRGIPVATGSSRCKQSRLYQYRT